MRIAESTNDALVLFFSFRPSFFNAVQKIHPLILISVGSTVPVLHLFFVWLRIFIHVEANQINYCGRKLSHASQIINYELYIQRKEICSVLGKE